MNQKNKQQTLMRNGLFLAIFSTVAAPAYANTELQNELNNLSNEVNALKSKLSTLTMAESASQEDTKGEVKLYATIRPSLAYTDVGGEKITDVNDALSHAGFKSTYEYMDGWSATIHGEWSIDLKNDGSFGKARQVYLATEGAIGRIGIGKQRPTQYTFIAEYVDIFNHASSPFSYDSESVFFVDNLVTYNKKFGDFTYMAAAQFNGAAGSDANDIINTGVSYDVDNLHIAVTYLDQKIADNLDIARNDEVWAGAVAYTFNSGLYAAIAYQDRTYKALSGVERGGHTLDTALAYPFANKYKIKAGYFEFDDGIEDNTSGKYDGYNVTLEWQPISTLRFHLEYLNRDLEFGTDFDSLTVGFRYDYSLTSNYN